jgi:hypothetical protein
MNNANDPEPVQPISSSRLSIHSGPPKCTAATGVRMPMNTYAEEDLNALVTYLENLK